MDVVIGKCRQQGCAGHLGKFPSCVAEVLWEWSLDPGGEDRSTGCTEAYGWFSAIGLEDEATQDLDGVAVIVPAGWYMITENDRGAVGLIEFATREELDRAFEEADRQYGEWLEINEPE